MKIIEFDPSRIFCENGFWGTSSVRSDLRFAMVKKWTPDQVRGDNGASRVIKGIVGIPEQRDQ